MTLAHTVLMIVDMQKYYLDPRSDFHRYFESLSPGCMDYISRRCEQIVIPNIARLIHLFRERDGRIIYLRLCGSDPVRRDLHRFFRRSWLQGKRAGYPGIYPLADEVMAGVVDDIAPREGDLVVAKTTFSAFSSTDIDGILKNFKTREIVFAGLATSQCVETTARDASDRGYGVIHVEDAQADYDENTHHASLFSSQGVCGGRIMTADGYIATL